MGLIGDHFHINGIPKLYYNKQFILINSQSLINVEFGLINRDLICSVLFVPVCCVGNVDFI